MSLCARYRKLFSTDLHYILWVAWCQSVKRGRASGRKLCVHVHDIDHGFPPDWVGWLWAVLAPLTCQYMQVTTRAPAATRAPVVT